MPNSTNKKRIGRKSSTPDHISFVTDRMKFLAEAFPDMEKKMKVIQQKIDDMEMTDENMESLLAIYRSMFSFYHNSMETVRKFYLQLPSDEGEQELLSLYRTAGIDRKRWILKKARDLVNTSTKNFNRQKKDAKRKEEKNEI